LYDLFWLVCLPFVVNEVVYIKSPGYTPAVIQIVYWGHDVNLSGSCDVIVHVTIPFLLLLQAVFR